MKNYKAMRDMSPDEKLERKNNDKGSPHWFWQSSKMILDPKFPAEAKKYKKVKIGVGSYINPAKAEINKLKGYILAEKKDKDTDWRQVKQYQDSIKALRFPMNQVKEAV